MKIFITSMNTPRMNTFFPEHLMEKLRSFGEVSRNPHARKMTREELAEELKDTDILITHWGTPQVDAEMLANAPRLKMLAHAAGTVAHIASEAFFEKGIPVLSANPLMARTVAEGALTYILAGQRLFVQKDRSMREKKWENFLSDRISLLDGAVGFIGCGAVARHLMDLLRPFGCKVYVYDPYLPEEALAAWDFARKVSFEEAMRQPVVSIHAAQMPETYHMINAEALALMPDRGLLINTSRGSLVDTQALIRELQTGRIHAVLDVYEKEGAGNQPDELLACMDNCILQPHIAAISGPYLTEGIVADIERFLRGEPLQLTVSLQQYRLMTQE